MFLNEIVRRMIHIHQHQQYHNPSHCDRVQSNEELLVMIN